MNGYNTAAVVRKYQQAAGDLERALRELRRHEASLRAVWSGPEVALISSSIQRVVCDLGRLAQEVRLLSGRIESAGQQGSSPLR